MLESVARSVALLLAAIEWKLMLPAVAALAGVWLQSRLSSRQTFNNKIWDLRREAYADFLAKIYQHAGRAKELADLLDDFRENNVAVPEERLSELERLLSLEEELSAITTRGSLVWSPSFSNVAAVWRDEWEKQQKDKDARGQIRAFADVTMKHFEDMHQAARADLKRR